MHTHTHSLFSLSLCFLGTFVVISKVFTFGHTFTYHGTPRYEVCNTQMDLNSRMSGWHHSKVVVAFELRSEGGTLSLFTLLRRLFIPTSLPTFLAKNLPLIWVLNWRFLNAPFLANMLILQNCYLSSPRNPLAKNHKPSVFLGLWLFVKLSEHSLLSHINSLPVLSFPCRKLPPVPALYLLLEISNYESLAYENI